MRLTNIDRDVSIIEHKEEKTMGYLQLDHTAVLDMLPDRSVTAHKGNFGKLLLLCGSKGYTGAASLAAMGALRTGAGLVYLGVPACIYAIEAIKLLEPIVFPLSDVNGMIAAAAVHEISDLLDKIDAVLIGPGLGRSKDTESLLIWMLKNYAGPMVIDADGIYLLRDHIDILRGRACPVILTPHEGEFSQLMGQKILNRTEAAVEAAKILRSIIVLKGHKTVITDGETVCINPTGNPGMAVGGSGDVLAGMITALIGQGLPALQAAAAGAWIHGAAGDTCAEQIGTYGMLPSDMLDVIPRLLK